MACGACDICGTGFKTNEGGTRCPKCKRAICPKCELEYFGTLDPDEGAICKDCSKVDKPYQVPTPEQQEFERGMGTFVDLYAARNPAYDGPMGIFEGYGEYDTKEEQKLKGIQPDPNAVFAVALHLAIERNDTTLLEKLSKEMEAARPSPAMKALATIQIAFAAYEMALRNREHGGIAAGKLVDAVSGALSDLIIKRPGHEIGR